MSSVHDLHQMLSDGSELNIVCHNNPDPDCLASALALGRIAADAGIDERHILYSGDISHQENRAFVNLLEIDLKPFDASALLDRPEDSLVAFVDHSTPGANNNVPPETAIDIVIDHHPAESIEARFVDHREEIGAAATILAEYVEALEMEVDPMLATALLFAIRRETLNFLRGATAAEYDAAGFLHDRVRPRIQTRQRPPRLSSHRRQSPHLRAGRLARVVAAGRAGSDHGHATAAVDRRTGVGSECDAVDYVDQLGDDRHRRRPPASVCNDADRLAWVVVDGTAGRDYCRRGGDPRRRQRGRRASRRAC